MAVVAAGVAEAAESSRDAFNILLLVEEEEEEEDVKGRYIAA